MQRASQLFTDEGRRRIDQAVAAAESKTSAELVPVVVTASGRYDRAEDIIGLWFGLVVMIVLWLLLPRQSAEPGSWGGIPLLLEMLLLVAGVVLAFIGGAAAGSRVAWLRHLFTPRNEMRDDVAARAREIFFDNRVHHTAGGTGLLVYVSLFEHMAAIIADQVVLDKLGQTALDELCAQLTEGLHGGNPTDAICAVLQSAGQRLAAVLPRAEDDINELSDALVTLD